MRTETRIERTTRGELRLANAIGHHVTMRLSDDRVIAPVAEERRSAARVLLRHGERAGLLAFRVVDTHVHALLRCDRGAAGAFAHGAEVALRTTLRLPVPFETARIRPVVDQYHLARAFHYVLRQEARHGAWMDVTHDGSSLPELLGLRVIDDRVARRVAASLPRLDFRTMLTLLAPPARASPTSSVDSVVGRCGDDVLEVWLRCEGLGEVRLEKRGDSRLEAGSRATEPGGGAVDLSRLADAAAAACAEGSLAGRSAPVHAARHAAVWVARVAGARSSAIAEQLHISPRSVRRLLMQSPDRRTMRAVGLQLGLRNWLATVASSPLVAPPVR